MPTYEYECKTCGHHFELFQKMSDEPVKTCPRCSREVRRLINGGSGIIFKGSGFYVTDKKGGAVSGASRTAAKTDAPAQAASAQAPAASAPAQGVAAQAPANPAPARPPAKAKDGEGSA
ncbi:MAG: zinc ribbon domain-containing protein [Treponema sp.]|jgi:putative FmdB family regulatory protein|nr:zinc ribbon domain-containing protein [Treponema sp.]